MVMPRRKRDESSSSTRARGFSSAGQQRHLDPAGAVTAPGSAAMGVTEAILVTRIASGVEHVNDTLMLDVPSA